MAGVQAIHEPPIADSKASAASSDANPQPSATSQPSANPQTKADTRNALFWFLQMCCRLVAPIYFRYRARGAEHVPTRGPALLVVNHQSFLDPVMAGIPLARPLRFLARDTLYRNPLISKLLRALYTIPLNRNAASSATIRLAISQLERGFLVGIFPEGTRSEDRQVGSLKPGFIALVRRSEAPVIPVGIAGTGESFPRGAWFVRPKTVRVVYGPPLELDQLAKTKGHGSEQALIDAVRDAMIRCYDEARAWRGTS